MIDIVLRRDWIVGLGALISAVAGYLIGWLMRPGHRWGVLRRWSVVAVITYLAVTALAFVNIQTKEPTLPSVTIGNMHGRLIAHGDRYWYLLLSSGEVRAVPDGADTVVIARQ